MPNIANTGLRLRAALFLANVGTISWLMLTWFLVAIPAKYQEYIAVGLPPSYSDFPRLFVWAGMFGSAVMPGPPIPGAVNVLIPVILSSAIIVLVRNLRTRIVSSGVSDEKILRVEGRITVALWIIFYLVSALSIPPMICLERPR